MRYKRFDVVVVPFPFTDRDVVKRRPALVISDARVFNTRIGHSVMAMITSARHSDWPLDVLLEDITNININKTTCRVPQVVWIKARCAGNGGSLAKHRNAEPGHLWNSLRASGRVDIGCVASACHSSGYARANAPCHCPPSRLLHMALFMLVLVHRQACRRHLSFV